MSTRRIPWLALIALVLLAVAVAGVVSLPAFQQQALLMALRSLLVWLPALYAVVALSYAGRYWRWRLLLGRLGIGRTDWPDLLGWFRGFALTATPAKEGELGRVQLLHEQLGYPHLLMVLLVAAAADHALVDGDTGRCRRCPSFIGWSPTQARLLAMAAIAPIRIRSAFVLGSTSEVAKSICRELARRGCARFHLVARNSEANQQLVAELQQRYGAAVSTEQTDLLSDAALEPVRRPEVGEFDLYLITAGSLGDAELARTDATEALRILAANVGGLIPWITAIATPERLARPGRLWVFSSVAADRGRPSNYHYGAAKAALMALCEGLLLRCHGKPFAVRIINAGFMATPMTESKAPPALCASPESVARDLLRRPNRRGIEYLPWWWSPLMRLIRLLPAPIASKL